jgi:hypothetical protein
MVRGWGCGRAVRTPWCCRWSSYVGCELRRPCLAQDMPTSCCKKELCELEDVDLDTTCWVQMYNGQVCGGARWRVCGCNLVVIENGMCTERMLVIGKLRPATPGTASIHIRPLSLLPSSASMCSAMMAETRPPSSACLRHQSASHIVYLFNSYLACAVLLTLVHRNCADS